MFQICRQLIVDRGPVQYVAGAPQVVGEFRMLNDALQALRDRKADRPNEYLFYRRAN
jgi:hypothetical protein